MRPACPHEAALLFQGLLVHAGADTGDRDPAWFEEPRNVFVTAERALHEC